MSRAVRLRSAVLIAGIASVMLPIWILWELWREPFTLLGFLFALSILLFLTFIARWDLVGTPLRYLFVAAFLLITFYKDGPGACVVVLVLLAALSVQLRHCPSDAIDMDFPLRHGTYYVVQGGQLSWLNHHHLSNSQRFAVDIVALNKWGMRGRGLYPRELKAYYVYGDAVYSPCFGVVTATEGNLPNVLPATTDDRNIAGNYIVIRLDGTNIHVALCHLMKDSISVRTGDRVEAMQKLALVGNSGNTSEPHLHVHAKRGGMAQSALDGEAIAVRFKSRWLIRGDVLRQLTGQ
jgi:hypothetical protein